MQTLTRSLGRPLLLMATLIGPFNCASTEVIKANATPAIQATHPIDPELTLDIGILPLEPGIPATEAEIEKKLIIPDVRRAESQYMAVHLKDTLEQTGNWGAVRVIPVASNAVDITIKGEILQSDGELVRIKLTATDASGKVWVAETYADQASKFSYSETRQDPFQDLYNEFANDLLAQGNKLTPDKIRNLRRLTSLRFASALASNFKPYIDQSGDRFSIHRLPAENDPMLQRIEKIKEREYLFVDTLDEYYTHFYHDMQESYNEWRRATYKEGINLRRLKKQARNRFLAGAALVVAGIYAASEGTTRAEQIAASGVVAGGIGAIKSGFDRKKESEIHAASLREISQSLGSEIKPYVLDIEGRTIELTGSANAQYKQWRKMLMEIYRAETGLTVAE